MIMEVYAAQHAASLQREGYGTIQLHLVCTSGLTFHKATNFIIVICAKTD
jgi:hypothetical protein